MGTGGGAASFKFNSFQEIRSHSSILYNERMAILFYILDMKNLELYKTKGIDSIYEVYAAIKQIYKNTRMLIRFNDTVRISMNLETKDQGIYTIDLAIGLIDKMLFYCEQNGFSEKTIYIIIKELENIEMLLKDILQYFQYFIRADFRQKPDVDIATERYKDIADSRTVDELRALVGKNHKVDFEGLGSLKIAIEESSIDYDPVVDGDISEYAEEDDGDYLEVKETNKEKREDEEKVTMEKLKDYSDASNQPMDEYLEEDEGFIDEDEL